MGHAFEFSPFGIVPIGGGAQGATAGSEMHGAQIVEAPAQKTITSAEVSALQTIGTWASTVRNTASGAKLAPRQLVKQAKARVRELNTEIKRLKTLIKERDELQRLIVAAKTKSPLARSSKVSLITRASSASS